MTSAKYILTFALLRFESFQSQIKWFLPVLRAAEDYSYLYGINRHPSGEFDEKTVHVKRFYYAALEIVCNK